MGEYIEGLNMLQDFINYPHKVIDIESCEKFIHEKISNNHSCVYTRYELKISYKQKGKIKTYIWFSFYSSFEQIKEFNTLYEEFYKTFEHYFILNKLTGK